MEDFALTDAERALLQALHERGVRFLIVGMGAALLEGAPVATQDVDVWLESLDIARLSDAARAAGGFWVGAFGMQPPAFGGDGLSRIDVVLTAHGLESFEREYARSAEYEVDGVPLRVLPLERVLASKRSLGRAKDLAAVPVLEATLKAREQEYD